MRKWKCVETTNESLWTVGKIYQTYDNGMGLCANNGDSNGWNSPWELTMAQFEEIKGFTKDDLEPCMVVVLRDDNIGIVVNTADGVAISSEDGCWFLLSSHNNDMTFNPKNNLDIIEVYGFSEYAHDNKANEISTKNRELLWKREEKSEKDLEIEKLESEVRDMANRIAKLKGE